MEFKIGDTVEVIDASGNLDAIHGDRGKVLDISEHFIGILVTVRTTDGREYSMYPKRFKKIKVREAKETMEFKVGQEVLVTDDSYSMELVNGVPQFLKEFISRSAVFEIIATRSQLPTDNGFIMSAGYPMQTNDTIIRNTKTNQVFFIQQRFLKETPKPEPKFKRGDIVVFSGHFQVVSIVFPHDTCGFCYGLTLVSETYNASKYYRIVYESYLTLAAL